MTRLKTIVGSLLFLLTHSLCFGQDQTLDFLSFGKSQISCGVNGACVGDLIQVEEDITSYEECLDICKEVEDCYWITYYGDTLICTLMERCPTLDEGCNDCVSGEQSCDSEKGISKLLVTAQGGKIAEIVDLSPAGLTCKRLADLPDGRWGTVGSLTPNKEPMICGGNYFNDCYIYTDKKWTATYNMSEKRAFASGVNFKLTPDSSLVVTGGYNGRTSTLFDSVEYLTPNGWKNHRAQLPKAIQKHCLVKINEKVLMLTGGESYDGVLSQDVYVYSNDTQIWNKGPSLNKTRSGHGCGKFLVDGTKRRFAVAVIGGYSPTTEASTEIFDFDSQSWIQGPRLPYGNQNGFATVNQAGKLFYMTGGEGDIFQLNFDGKTGEWVKLPQKLAQAGPAAYFTAFFVPDKITECS